MLSHSKKSVAIVGAGPAGLMAADVLSRSSELSVTIYDAMPSAGRKFLMAGRGGLNLTHSESIEPFIARYGARDDVLKPLLDAFSPTDVRVWCENLGQQTFVGSSGRVFPKAMKASGLLRAWLHDLAAHGVDLKVRHRWRGWTANDELVFETPQGETIFKPDATILALGGASWPRLGSDGSWVPLLQDQGVDVAKLQPSNCGFTAAWSDVFRQRFEGHPLKGVVTSHAGVQSSGDLVVSKSGLEGGAIYALSATLRNAILVEGRATLSVDLKPGLDHDALSAALNKTRGKQTFTNFVRKASRLSPVAIGLLQECALRDGIRLPDLSPADLAGRIKATTVALDGIGSFEKAISTAGGVAFEAIDERLMLRKKPGVFVAGEMLDWDAPTGGYLLQACFAMGRAAGQGVSDWLHVQRSKTAPADHIGT